MTKGLSAKIVEIDVERPRIHLRYPQVTGLPNELVQQRINNHIDEIIISLLREQGFIEEPEREFWITNQVRVNKCSILSITIDVYSYAPHYAHGLTVRKSLTTNLETGYVYSLKDLFKVNRGYQYVISEIIKQQIKSRDIPLINEFKLIDANEGFFLTDDSLVIYFQTYEYTPYVVGIPEFPIPYTALKGLINERGPIAKLMKN